MTMDGLMVYYNKLLVEYIIHYSNGSRDFVKDQDFDGKELFFCWFETYMQKSSVETLSHVLFLRDNAVLCYLRAVINLSITNTAN